MGLRSFIGLVSLLSVFAFAGCSTDAQKIEPATRGKRGENCQARNDCEKGLACLSGICAKNEFNLEVTAKQCDLVECTTDVDCCGDRKTVAPAKCEGREAICTKPTLTGCTTSACTSSATCLGGGTCPVGTCQGSPTTMCETAAECPKNTCVLPAGALQGTCSTSGAFCSADFPCAAPLCNISNFRQCNCQNPVYDPTDDICSDPDCDDICLLSCSDDSRCVTDKSCKLDADCGTTSLLRTCDGGRCVQCTDDAGCDEKNNETCEKGLCKKPCEQNEECGLFEACNKKGDCVYVGCQSDRECVLAASRASQVSGEGAAAPINGGADDPRLFKCLESEEDPTIKTCKIPCENDGSCGQFQVCDLGFCKFVGCETDDECRAYLGISNEMTSEAKPFIKTAVCREALAAAP